MSIEDLMLLGLKRPAARLLNYLLENPGPKTQNDIILTGILKQPYISIAARNLSDLGLLKVEEMPLKRGAPIKAYSLIPTEEIRAALMKGVQQDYEQKKAAATSF